MRLHHTARQPLGRNASQLHDPWCRSEEQTAATREKSGRRLGNGGQAKGVLSVRKIWEGSRYGNTGSVSADGRYLSFTRWVPNSQLGVLDTQTGQDWDVTKATASGYTQAMGGVFSPDAAELAYSWQGTDRIYELRIAPRAGGTPRTIYRASDQTGYAAPAAWSSDKKRILCQLRPGNRVVWISVADGSVTELASLGETRSPGVSLSPDGRFIAFNRLKQGSTRDSDVFVISASGGAETPFIAEANREILLGWAPDGDHVLIGSDRTGRMGAWLVPIRNGRPVGDPVLVKDYLGDAMPMGFDNKGTFYYNINPGGAHRVFIADLDPSSGRITSPVLANSRHLGGSWRPRFSPDGKSLVMQRLARQSGTVPSGAIVVELASGTEKVTSVAGVGLFAWRADSSLIGIRGPKFVEVNFDGREAGEIDLTKKPVGNGCNGSRVIRHGRGYISVDSGAAVDAPVESPLVAFSPDCSQAAWTKDGVLFVSAATKGATSRELARPPAGQHFQDDATSQVWSLDGRYLYFVTYRDYYSDYELWRISSAGGNATFTGIKMPDIRHMTIHPDGKRIAFTSVQWNYEAWAIDNMLPHRPAAASSAKR